MRKFAVKKFIIAKMTQLTEVKVAVNLFDEKRNEK